MYNKNKIKGLDNNYSVVHCSEEGTCKKYTDSIDTIIDLDNSDSLFKPKPPYNSGMVRPKTPSSDSFSKTFFGELFSELLPGASATLLQALTEDASNRLCQPGTANFKPSHTT